MLSGLAHQAHLPQGAQKLARGFILLRAKERTHHWIPSGEARAFHAFLVQDGWVPEEAAEDYSLRIQSWARLRLPNGRVARSLFARAERRPLAQVRTSRIVKVSLCSDLPFINTIDS